MNDNQMPSTLEDLEEYLADREDCDDGIPNNAMKLLAEVRAALILLNPAKVTRVKNEEDKWDAVL